MYRILHVLAQRPGRTGSGIFLNHLIRQAARKNMQQAVIIGIPADEKIEFNDLQKRHHYPVYFNTSDLPFPVAGMSDVMPYKSTRYSDLDNNMLQAWNRAFINKLQLAAHQFQPQVIITHHLWLLTGLVRKVFPEIPVIAVAHGTGLRQLDLAPNLKDKVINGCRTVDLVLALNYAQKKQIRERYMIPAGKIIVTGGAYDADIFFPHSRPATKPKNTRLVFCGKLSQAKGIFQLLEVYSNLSQRFKNIELIIIGSGQGPEAESVKELAALVPGKISFTGAVEQVEVGKIFRQCDIFVLPSFYEGMALVVLEALASGLKVVTTDIPGLSSWLGDKVNQSDQIIYVKLPRMKKIDQPYKEDLEEFKEELEKAILKMIADINSDQVDGCSSELTAKSWDQLFDRIYQQIEKLINI